MEKKKWVLFILFVLLFFCLAARKTSRRPKAVPESYALRAAGGGAAPKPDEEPPNSQRGALRSAPPCGCVFDIDDTLTCGNPANVVRMCKENGCALGLNTARNMPYALDVPLKEQGFPPNVLNSEDFVYNPAPTFDNVVPTKVEGLREFQRKWKIDSPSKILFFDDNLANIKGANAAGFTGVWCSKTYQPRRGSARPGAERPTVGGATRCGIGVEQEKLTDIFFRRQSLHTK